MSPKNTPPENEHGTRKWTLGNGDEIPFERRFRVSFREGIYFPTNFLGGKLFQPVTLFKQAKAQKEAKQAGDKCAYTPGSTNIAMENPPFWWYLSGKMGIFHAYVTLPKGSLLKAIIFSFTRMCDRVDQLPLFPYDMGIVIQPNP